MRDSVSLQTYTCVELSSITKELIASRHASIMESGKQIADLLAASHNTLQVRLTAANYRKALQLSLSVLLKVRNLDP